MSCLFRPFYLINYLEKGVRHLPIILRTNSAFFVLYKSYIEIINLFIFLYMLFVNQNISLNTGGGFNY